MITYVNLIVCKDSYIYIYIYIYIWYVLKIGGTFFFFKYTALAIPKKFSDMVGDV